MEKKEKKQKSKLQSFLMLVAVLTLFFIPLQLSLGQFMYNKTFDFMVQNIGGKITKPHEDVVLVLIDQTSMLWGEKLGLGRWPWSRDIYSDILNYMNFDQGPKAIFFDIMFSARDKTNDVNDTIFSQAISDSANVFHNVFFQYNVDAETDMELPLDIATNFALRVKNRDILDYRHKTFNEIEMPLACLRADVTCDKTQYETDQSMPICMGIGIALAEPDDDGVYRRIQALYKYSDKYFPSIATSALIAFQNMPNTIEAISSTDLRIGEFEVPLNRNREYLINYHVKERIPSYSMSIVLESAISFYDGETDNITIPPDFFNNKIVIIGVSAIGGQDLKNSPIKKDTPGPEIHANMISNILQQNHVHQIHPFGAFIISLILLIITVYIVVFRDNPLVKIAVNVAIYSLYAVITMAIFHYTNYLFNTIFTLSTGIIATTGSYMFLSVTEGAERRKYSKILGNMIDPTIVNEALTDLDSLKKGGEKNITAFFSDVASFSTISEKLTSAELAALLNEYLSAMTVVLKKHYGTLDKYIGDAIVGIFGAPVEIDRNALHACRASIEMLDEMKLLKEKWVRDNAYCPEAQVMNFRIGLNTGIAKVGFMGTDQLASYTMMGDTVNLASRLEAAGKDYGVTTLISESTAEAVKDEMFVRRIDRVKVKGKTQPADIYELIALKSNITSNLVEAAELYEEGFELYQNHNWNAAMRYFRNSLKAKQVEDDKAVAMLIARCKFYKKSPPPSNWDGAFTRTHK
jgi:adenylate cyclase